MRHLLNSRGDFAKNTESRCGEVRFVHPGYGAAGVGILPKQRPSKARRKKKKCTLQFIPLG